MRAARGAAAGGAAAGGASRGAAAARVRPGGSHDAAHDPSSTRSCGRNRNCPAVRGTSSGGRFSMAAADSGAITEK